MWERRHIFISVFTLAFLGYLFVSHNIDIANNAMTIQKEVESNFDPSEMIGRNWIPALQPRISMCLNLANLAKSMGNATIEESVKWTSLGCLTVLRSFYRLW